ncbi:perlucin-like [Saccostrea cucullata]|uniref:perlucin-like n=1 Tax=Saccostrea cuccullata TaxID=36930 RepID=UPI002ED6955D
MYAPLYVPCIILTFLNFINSFQQSTEYVHVFYNDNQITTTNILLELTNIPSLSSCSAMCRKRADSISFFYNSAIKKCVCTGPLECQELGAKLAEIETKEENTFLKNYAVENNYGTAFIGGTDAFSQNRWRWSTTFKPITFTDWAPGKPDTTTSDECLTLSANIGMSWDDHSCDFAFSFICERMMI